MSAAATPRGSRLPAWLRVVRLVLVAYLTLLAFAWFAGERKLYPAPPPSYEASDRIRFLERPDGIRIAWKHYEGYYRQTKFVILYFHGNGEDLGTVEPFALDTIEHVISFLSWDYRGYGQSTGRPSEQANYEDAEAMLALATGELGYQPHQVILWGRSLGGGIAVELARRHPDVGGLVLESAFLSAITTLTRVPILPFDWYRNGAKIPEVKVPVFVIHGELDTIVPVSHGRRLYELAPGPKESMFIPAAGHNDIGLVTGEEFWERIEAWLQSLLDRRGTTV